MTNDELYRQARKRFDESAASDSEDRITGDSDLRFYAGEQWDENESKSRGDTSRPVLTVNQIPKYVRQITGEARLNQVGIRIQPADDKSDPSLAEMLSGLTKAILADSDADTIFETGLDCAAQCGRGGFRLLTDYENDDSFNQVIKLRAIDEPFSIYWDANAKDYTKEDAEYCFVVRWISKEEYETKYGEEPKSFTDQGHGDRQSWERDDEVRIAEYFMKTHTKRKLWQLMDGTIIKSWEDPCDKETFAVMANPVVNERDVDEVTINRYIMDGAEFKEGPAVFPSKYIPVIPVMGPSVTIDGKKQYWSAFRWGKTPQQLYNLWLSTITEKTSLSPKAPFIGTVKMFKNQENQWRDANIKNFAVLAYTPDDKAPGQKPERSLPSPIQQAELGLMQQAKLDMDDSIGIYRAGLGDQGNEVSGVAIGQRQAESDVGTLDWIDNLHRSVAYCGKVIVDMIPRVYDTQRVVAIIGEEDALEWVTLNQMSGLDAETQQPIIRNDISVGRYNAVIDSGPSFKTQREESSKMLVDLVRALPQDADQIIDIAVKNMDFKGADEVGKRLAIKYGHEDPDPEDMKPPPPPDPILQLEVQKRMADLEGKALMNAERQLKLAESAPPELQQQAYRDMLQTLEQSTGGQQ